MIDIIVLIQTDVECMGVGKEIEISMEMQKSHKSSQGDRLKYKKFIFQVSAEQKKDKRTVEDIQAELRAKKRQKVE